MEVIVVLLGSYFCGAIPFGYLIVKIFKDVDIRKYASGNTGATNVYRVSGKTAGVTVFVLDLLKGFFPVIITSIYFGDDSSVLIISAGLVSIIGHMWPIFLGFKGGKGVATGTGVFLALLPVPTACAFVIFSIVLFFSRYVSLGSIVASVSLPVISVLMHEQKLLVVFAFAVSLAVIIKHAQNIKRLFSGNERKLGRLSIEKEDIK